MEGVEQGCEHALHEGLKQYISHTGSSRGPCSGPCRCRQGRAPALCEWRIVRSSGNGAPCAGSARQASCMVPCA